MELGTGATPSAPPLAADAPSRHDADVRAAALARVNRRPRLRLGWLWEWAKVTSAAIVLFFFVRAFFVEAYKIPSASMERTILVGDFLLVNKLVYGAEVPFSGGKRLPRLRTPVRGDVVVFDDPKVARRTLVKRLIGLPGDTVAMRGGVLFVNARPRDERYVEHTEPGSDPTYESFRWQRDFVTRTAVAAPVVVAPVAATLVPDVTRIPLAPLLARRDPSAHPTRDNWGPLVVPAAHYFVLGDNRDNSFDSRYWGFVPDSLLRGRPLFVYYSYAPDSATRLAWLTHVRWRRLGTRIE